MEFLVVGVGGALGALARFTMARALSSVSATFPLSTLTINLLGSFGLGFLYSALRSHPSFSSLQLLIGIGFLGAFTTFSTFSFETVELLRRGDLGLAATYSLGSVAIGLAAVLLGDWTGSLIR